MARLCLVLVVLLCAAQSLADGGHSGGAGASGTVPPAVMFCEMRDQSGHGNTLFVTSSACSNRTAYLRVICASGCAESDH